MITIFIGSILEIINKVIFKKSMSEEKIYADKMFSKNFSGILNILFSGNLFSIIF